MILLDFLLQCKFRSNHCRRIYPTLCTELFKPQESPHIYKETFHEVKPELLCKALRFTSKLPEDLYTPAECVEQVEYFTQKIQKKKFNSEYGPDIHNERLEILEFLYLVEKFLADIFQKFFDYDTKSESSRSKSGEEENTEDSTQDSK